MALLWTLNLSDGEHTLFDIARYELGKATRWAEIYQLNRDQIGADFNHLRPGTQLVLPEDLPTRYPLFADTAVQRHANHLPLQTTAS